MLSISPLFRILSLPVFVGLLLMTACSRSPETRIRDGVEAWEQGNPERAYRKFRAAAERLPEEAGSGALWNAVGVSAAAIGKEEEAEQAFLKAVDLNPGLDAAFLNAGLLYRVQGRSEEARTVFRRAVEADPAHTEALELQAVEALRRGETERAREYIRQAVSREETARTLSSMGVLSRDILPLQERRELLQRAVTRNPQYAPAQLNLAALLDQHRLDPEQAVAHYEAFARLEPDSPLVPQVVQRTQVMEARIASGNISIPDPVREEVEELLRQASAAPDPRSALGFCLRAHAAASRASRSDLRERALRAATALAPDSARARVGLGRFLQEQGREREAYREFESALEISSQWPPALTGAVQSLVSLGEVQEAESLLEKLVDGAVESPEVLLTAGDLYRDSLGNTRKAQSLYRELIADFPDSAAAESAASRLPPAGR